MIELIFLWIIVCVVFFILMAVAALFADLILSLYWPDDQAWPNRHGDDDEYD